MYILLLFLVSFLFPGCRRTEVELPVTPPLTHPLAREYLGYGVVNVSFTHLLDEPGADGKSRSYIRRGTLVRIMERRQLFVQGNPETWVLAEGNYRAQAAPPRGWLREIELNIYDTESRAETAAETLEL